jgi:hypothetical protein
MSGSVRAAISRTGNKWDRSESRPYLVTNGSSLPILRINHNLPQALPDQHGDGQSRQRFGQRQAIGQVGFDQTAGEQVVPRRCGVAVFE